MQSSNHISAGRGPVLFRALVALCLALTTSVVSVIANPGIVSAAPPAAPNATAAAGDKSVTLTWTDNSGTAGSATVASYKVLQAANATAAYNAMSPQPTITTSGANKQAVISGLTNGTKYFFKVEATGNASNSGTSVSAEAAATPAAAPDKVGAISVSPGDKEATLSWSAPAKNGADIQYYLLQFAEVTSGTVGGYTALDSVATITAGTPAIKQATGITAAPARVTPTTVKVEGLDNTKTYVFQVRAVNSAGNSPWSDASPQVSPAAAPGAPTAITATAKDGKVDLVITGPTGGSDVTGFKVSQGTRKGSTTAGNWNTTNFENIKDVTDAITVTGTTTKTGKVTVTGLTNGTTYFFVAKATSAAGESPIFPDQTAGTVAVPTSATPAAKPGATPNVVAKSVKDAPASGVTTGSVTLTWDALTGSATGGSAITGYKITQSKAGAAYVDSAAVVTLATRTATVSGLEFGKSYTFKVAAINTHGTSATPGTSGSVVVASKPSKPSVSGIKGNKSATVSWSGANPNGSAITGYKVTQSTTSGGTYTASTVEKVTDTVVKVTGLTNGTNYYFKVVATNAVGDSVASDPSSLVVPGPSAPDAPSIVKVESLNEALKLTWEDPADNGGSAITGYKVYEKDGTSYNLLSASEASISGKTATILSVDAGSSTLTNGTEYTFVVKATNANGDSVYSKVASGTPSNKAAAPTDVKGTAADKAVDLKWTASSTANGLAPTGYKVMQSTDGTTYTAATATVTGTTAKVTGLTNGTAYTFKVVATSAGGDSPASAASAAVTPAPAATNADGTAATPITKPGRLADTRANGVTVDGLFRAAGALEATSTYNVKVLGRGGVPVTGVGSVALNVTVVGPTAPGYVTAFPAGQTRPNASNVNFVAGETRANAVVVPVGLNGEVTFYNHAGNTNIIVDVLEWYPASGSFTGVTPERIVDTRATGTTKDGKFQREGKVGAMASKSFTVTGRGGVPATGAGYVALNVTVTDATAPSFVTAYPSGVTRPEASNLNFGAGQISANMVIVPIGADGKVSVYNRAGSTNVIVDVLGWYPVNGKFTAASPKRMLDTRPGFKTVDGLMSGVGKVDATETVTVKIAGRNGVPATGLQSVALNLTATNPSAASFVTAYPADKSRPGSSNLNFVAGQTVPNAVIVPVSANGEITLYNHAGSTDLIVDVLGWTTK